jgi:glycosyltransferase involved in cell wall biosynthesis
VRRGPFSEWAQAHLPPRAVESVRWARAVLLRVRLAAREAPRWYAIRRVPAPRDGVHVYYGRDRLPGPDDVVVGGAVKFARLAEVLPNQPRRWNVLYLGSSSLPLDAPELVRLAARRGARFAWNQDGVRYPGLGLPDVEGTNRRNAELLHAADHVFFQSAFCKESADRFCGERRDAWEILYNAVDTTVFTPAPAERPRELTLLLGGSQYQRYRVESALRTLALVARERPDARLVITGALSFDRPGDARDAVLGLAAELGMSERIELVGPYARTAAPALLRRVNVLLSAEYG